MESFDASTVSPEFHRPDFIRRRSVGVAGQLRAIAGALIAACASSACSLLNPYVRAPELDAADIQSGLPLTATSDNKALMSAIALAAKQRARYYDAVSDRAKVRNGLPLLLIPLSAAAIYRGVLSDGGSSTRRILLKEGLLGAGMYGLASYYTSSTREQVYLAGAKALSCSIYATTPYFLANDLAQALDATTLQALNGKTGELERRRQELQEGRNKSSTAVQEQLDPLIVRAGTSVANARKVLRQAMNTRSILGGAGARLLATVENIVTEVDLQISQLEPDPSVILTVAGSLPATAKQFAPGGTFGSTGLPAVPAPAVAAGELDRMITELAPLIDSVDEEAGVIQFALDAVAQQIQAVPALDTCQVQGVKGRIDISPADGSLDMKPGETRQFVIRSTVGIPSVEWVGPFRNDKGQPVSLEKQVAGNTVLVQLTYAAVVEGLSQVAFEVADASQGLKQQITLNLLTVVSSAPQPNSKPVEAVGTSPPLADGAARNAFEKGLSANEIKQMQARLGAIQTGKFDPGTRSAILRWQTAKSWPVKDGTLQSSTYAAIMK